jgi:hypothetical protein
VASQLFGIENEAFAGRPANPCESGGTRRRPSHLGDGKVADPWLSPQLPPAVRRDTQNGKCQIREPVKVHESSAAHETKGLSLLRGFSPEP